MFYRIYTYDVCFDGQSYYVNDTYRSSFLARISNPNDLREVKSALFRSGVFGRGICTAKVRFSPADYGDDVIAIDYADKPLCELRLEQ